VHSLQSDWLTAYSAIMPIRLAKPWATTTPSLMHDNPAASNAEEAIALKLARIGP
jgi:hypothetical protein